jgi:hypothetical protein
MNKVYHVHQIMQPQLFCKKDSNKYLACDRSEDQIGPIQILDHDETVRNNNAVFYLTNRSPLNTSRYEFHQSKKDQEQFNFHSFMYMLFDLQNLPINKLKDFVDFHQEDQTQIWLKNFRIQQSLGTEISQI